MFPIKKVGKLFRFNGLFSIIFYIALIALIWYLIIPRTGIFYRKFFYRPYYGQLNKIDVTLVKGETDRIYVLGLNKRVSYSSTDISVADVTIFGGVTGYRAGTTIIKVKVNKKVLRCRVRVVDINKKNLKLTIGNTYKLKIKGAIFGIKWSSSNDNIVKVTKKGKIIGVSEGNATISGKIGGKILKCEVRVIKAK
jgi:uncharacterized protein YjdB